MFKKVSQLFLIIILIFTTSFSAFAQDLEKVRLEFMPSVENYENQEKSESERSRRAPNGIPITVTAKTTGTGCDVYVGNLGADGLDKVKVYVKATGYSYTFTKQAYVPPIVGKNFSFTIPMIKCDTEYDVKIVVQDGGQIRVLYGNASLTYSEEFLEGVWNKGTFGSRCASLENHFERHGSEVGSNNLVHYLNSATQYRYEILEDIENGDLSDYKVTVPSQPIPSKKYKNLNDGRFIILADSNQEIFSFGR